MAMWQVTQLEERRRSMSVRLYGLDHVLHVAGAELDEIAMLVRDALDVDGAAVNLLVDDAQVTVGRTGPIDIAPVPRDISVCWAVHRAYPGQELIEIPDLTAEPALATNPFVDGSMAALRFYAAAPLIGKHGLVLGTLCAWAMAPTHLDDRQRSLLRQLGRSVVNVLDERRRALVADDSGILRPAR